MSTIEWHQLQALWRRHRVLAHQQRAVLEQRSAVTRRLEKDFRIAKPEASAGRATKNLLSGIKHLSVKAVEKLLALGADPDAQNESGETPLLLACYRKDQESFVRLLVNIGANVNLADDCGNTPLIVSAADDRLKTVRLLVDRGADVNAQNVEGDTPLTNASIWGERRTVQFLLSRGADPGLVDGLGCSAMDLASQKGNQTIAAMMRAVMVEAAT